MSDIYKRHLVQNASEKHYLMVGRICIFVVLGLALAVVYKARFLFNVAIFMVGLATAEMSGNWAQWWWWRFNGWGRLAASFGGDAVYVAMVFFFPQMAWWTRMYVVMVVSTLLWLLVTLVTPPEPRSMLETFYARARPMGWWGPFLQHGVTVSSVGNRGASQDYGLKKIAKGILIAAGGAISVMCYIVGLSNLYFGRFLLAAVQLSATIILGFFFWRFFTPYIMSLMTPEEASQITAEQRTNLAEP